jgi:hypothetical protein
MSTPARFAEIVAALNDPGKVASLSDDALHSLTAELRDFFVAVRADEFAVADKVATLTDAADHIEGCAYVIAERADRTAAVTRRAGIVDPELEPVPTAVPALSSLQTPAAHKPVVTGNTSRITNMRDRTPATFDDIVQATCEAIDEFGAEAGMANTSTGPYFERIGRFTVDHPVERRVSGDDSATFNSTVESLTAGAWMPERWADLPNSLTASGGFCAPAQPDYEIFQISGSQRPVASYLPTVQAPRGQIIVAQPPKLVEVLSSTAQVAGSAVSIWTNAVDTTPGGTTKPVQTMSCPAPITVSTQAIVQQVKAGNFQGRANPELVAAFLKNVAAQWARRAEQQLLSQIDTNSTAVSSVQILGAVNDFVGVVRRAAAQQRNRQRMPADAQLRLLIPAWTVDFFASDLAHSHPGDGLERFAITEATVRSWLSAANIGVTFYQDSAAAVPGITFQQAVAQGPTDLQNWPPGPGATSARVIGYLFPEGTYARADAGSLDLGIVRDSTLNATNDFEVFSESWEAVIPKVIESLKLTMTLCDTGAGASDVSSAGYCTSS